MDGSGPMRRILQLIGDVYECADEAARWPSALERIASAFGAMDAMISGVGSDGNPWCLASGGVGSTFSIADVLPDGRLSTISNREVSGQVGVLVSSIVLQNGELVQFAMFARRDFGPRHHKLHATLLPHIARVLHLNRRLQLAETDAVLSSQAFEAWCEAALLVDIDLYLLRSNRAGDELLSTGRLGRCDGRLVCSQPEDNDRLLQLVARCNRFSTGTGADAISVACGDTATLTIMASPVSFTVSALGGVRRGAMLFIRDSGHRVRQLRERLVRDYGLTPAEVALALEMQSGDGKHAVAARMRISYATARTHLARIFAKTGVRRQAELVRLLNELA